MPDIQKISNHQILVCIKFYVKNFPVSHSISCVHSKIPKLVGVTKSSSVVSIKIHWTCTPLGCQIPETYLYIKQEAPGQLRLPKL